MEKRIIKFRAWLPEDKVWIEYCGEKTFTLDEIVSCGSLSEEWIWSQWTGLLDKNGKEIYEGDIIRILYTDWLSQSPGDPRTLEQYLTDISEIGEVVYNENTARFLLKLKRDNGGFVWGEFNEGKHGKKEVIGNIFENSDLLNNKE